MSQDALSFDQQYGELVSGTLDLFQGADHSDLAISWDPEKRLYIGPEVKIVHQTIEAVEELNKRSKVIVDRVRDQLRALSHEQERLRIASTRPLGLASIEEHQKMMEQSRQQLFLGYKKNSELEQTHTSLQAELARLQFESRGIDAGEQNDQLATLGSDVLKISIYRSLGFLPKQDREGRITGVIINSQTSDQVKTIDIDQETSDFHWSNTLWKSLAV